MDVISPELPQVVRLIIALGIVIAMMGGLAYIVRKLGLATPVSIKSDDKRRLEIVESLPMDARRRLAIIRCDGREHLVILSATGETVVERNILSDSRGGLGVDGRTVVDELKETHNNA